MIILKRNRKHNPASSRITHKQNKRKNNNKKATFKKVINIIFVLIFLTLIACAGIGAGMYAAIVGEVNDMNMHDLAIARSSIVYYTDKNGNSHEVETISGEGNCIWVESSSISDIMKEAIVSIEDERFYSHSGVDIKRSTGAVLGYIREKLGGSTANYGGSTITQQVVKNITHEKDRTAIRKIKEMMRAVAIEKQLSKDEILTIYLNVIYLANNCYGVEAASEMYFGKNASELNLTEAALIAGITQRPSHYDPIRNPENAKAKRDTVLTKMYELEKISKEEYEDAIASDLGLSGNHEQFKSEIYSYFVDTVITDVIKDLQTVKGYTEAFAKQQVYSGGLKIYATMDYDVQEAMEDVFENPDNFTGGAKDAQASMIIIDPKTGAVKGIIGGKGKKTESRGLNRATQTTRQPGSSIKPLSVYAPALEKEIITPSTIVRDEPIKIKNWEPVNSYSGYKGSITVKKAVEISANIPAIKVLQELGINTSFDYITNKFHLSTIVPADRDFSPLSLGGLTEGVTVKDMAAAYSVFANSGIYSKPYTYTKVLDSRNRVILENQPQQERVLEEATAFIMSELLEGVITGSSGTGRSARLSNMSAYGKTGTTNNNYDKWFVGYTPYYTGAVWFGFDLQTNLSKKGISGNPSAKLWKMVMEKVHEGLEDTELASSENIVSAWVCEDSGLLAKDNCDATKEYFQKGTQPKKYCSWTHDTTPVEESPVPEVTEAPTETQDTGNEPTQTPSDTITPEENPQKTTPTPTSKPTPSPTPDGVITLD